MSLFSNILESEPEDFDGIEPRSTLLPPPPSGVELPEAPRTMRVPASPDPALALIDAAMAEDIDIDMDYDDFELDDPEESRPTRRRFVCRPASPTLPCRIA